MASGVKFFSRSVGFLSLLLLLSPLGASAEEVKGKIKSVAGKVKTISIAVENKGSFIFKFNERTLFKNVPSAKELNHDDAVSVEYQASGGENLANIVTLAVAKLPDGISEISTDELLATVKKGPKDGNYALIDSRPAGKYNESHIPTAVSIPFNELEKNGEKLLPADKKTLLIFYCGGVSCVLSPKSAALAQKMGFSNIKVYRLGEPGWKKAELNTAASPEFVKNGNLVLVDLRAPEKVKNGHIPRAVNITISELEGAAGKFPAFKGAPIVFYSDNEEDLKKAVEQMRDWEYKNATVFIGGVDAWKAKGFEVKTGPAAKNIVYARKLAPGEVAIKDFEQAIKEKIAVVIDARSTEEFAKGHIKDAINIPAEEVARLMDRIPADKPLMVHCSTGARAEMVYDSVKAKCPKISFLRANVEFASDGGYKITE